MPIMIAAIRINRAIPPYFIVFFKGGETMRVKVRSV